MTLCLESAEKLLVLGIGNVLLGDEGAGVHAVRRLSRELGEMRGVHYLDGGSLGFTLAPDIEDCDALIVMDAAELGRLPGAVAVFEGEHMDRFLGSAGSRTAHDAGLRDVMAAAVLGGKLPSRRALICIQAGYLESATRPSAQVLAAIEKACELARDLIGRWR